MIRPLIHHVEKVDFGQVLHKMINDENGYLIYRNIQKAGGATELLWPTGNFLRFRD